MRHFIGLDAHSATFTLAAVNRNNEVVFHRKLATSGRNLICAVGELEGPKGLTTEEGTLAQWIKTTLEPYVEELEVCDPRVNGWIADAEYNDDLESAVKLARLYRGGYTKAIPHPHREGARLRRLFLHYYDLNREIVRYKNKIKATFRQRGIRARGRAVYSLEERSRWLERLTGHPSLRAQASDQLQTLDTLEEQKQKTYRRMVRRARGLDRAGFEAIKSIPGAGGVITTGYMAMIVTPHRFSRVNKLWKYAGFGNIKRSSGGHNQKDQAADSGNRVLKWVTAQHFTHAVKASAGRGASNRFTRCYMKQLTEGKDDSIATRTVCRKLLSVVRAVWRDKEPYRDDA